ncbi:MAG: hypothetical protein M1113_03785 [Candidatus Thermoplasmatota archaeon]|nr:hypothetical protein [Candidatus Thermoplasmatota archaeon]
MDDEDITEELRKMIMFGVNRTAILYNKERLADPEKYDFWYQWDHFWFQVRRARDPGFFRHTFALSHKSHNFESNRSFVMKLILRDLCVGKFNTEQLSGIVDLESIHKKNKSGDYEPRHTRRRLNEELRELVVEKGRVDSDERKISYSSAFRINLDNTDPMFEKAKGMWEEEIRSGQRNHSSAVNESRPIFLKEVYPERWEDLISLRKEMLKVMSTFEGEIREGSFFSNLLDEISTFSPYFVILSNHLNSICEIFWFMKKNMNSRSKLLISEHKLKIDFSEIETSLALIESTGWKSSDIVNILSHVPNALIFFGFEDIAFKLMDKIMQYDYDNQMGAALGLEYVAMLRNQGKYRNMLDLSELTIKKNQFKEFKFTYALLKIRNAEALALNGRFKEAVDELEEIFERRDELEGNYVPYINQMKELFDFVLTEKEPTPKSGDVPIRVSLLENLTGAALRISEYCLAKKYLEELFETEAEYFKREEAMNSFLRLNEVYNETIFKCR